MGPGKFISNRFNSLEERLVKNIEKAQERAIKVLKESNGSIDFSKKFHRNPVVNELVKDFLLSIVDT